MLCSQIIVSVSPLSGHVSFWSRTSISERENPGFSIEKWLEIARRHNFLHSFGKFTYWGTHLSDGMMIAYLGGLITAVSDLGGSTVVGSNKTLDQYCMAVYRGCHCILMRLINTEKGAQYDIKNQTK